MCRVGPGLHRMVTAMVYGDSNCSWSAVNTSAGRDKHNAGTFNPTNTTDIGRGITRRQQGRSQVACSGNACSGRAWRGVLLGDRAADRQVIISINWCVIQ